MAEPPQETLVDARGLACPQPVVLARKALLGAGAGGVRVLVDNQVSVENIGRMARSQGWEVSVEGQGAQTEMLLRRVEGPSREGAASPVPQAAPAPPVAKARVVVLFSSDLFGMGDETLGRVLMRSFVKTLAEVEPLPSKMIFVNSGVRLTTEGSELLDDLAALADSGVEIVSCGTCLDYYKLMGALRVGTVTNMHDIASSLSAADRIVRP